ncbi:MAG: hypothetical protein JSV88_03315 [Candidatus Aminicenantes bacterium]|nr:MAG: hypothetical protein JSV88_03315 [Candidatus Aminicenantes bacterium]
MEIYKFETTITKDGRINLPQTFKDVFNHRVEITLRDKEKTKSKKELKIPTFLCGGKLRDLSREELYDDRF